MFFLFNLDFSISLANIIVLVVRKAKSGEKKSKTTN